jgi:hypothetical protein
MTEGLVHDVPDIHIPEEAYQENYFQDTGSQQDKTMYMGCRWKYIINKTEQDQQCKYDQIFFPFMVDYMGNNVKNGYYQ